MSFDLSDSFDFLSSDNNSGNSSKTTRVKQTKRGKTISTSDFILVLLFIFLSVTIGICVHNRYYH